MIESHPSTIDLNADLGEGCAWDEPLLGLVTSAAVSCGAHAGDPEAILLTLEMARARGVVVGAHPGYPDREGFGRRPRAIDAEGARTLILEQVATLTALADKVSASIRFVKPHGAFYNQAQDDESIASGIVAAVKELGIPVLGLPGGAVERRAISEEVAFIAEGFADRRYRPDGRLVPRSEPEAVLDDPETIRRQVLDLAAGGRVRTLCIHGDDPRSVALAEQVRAILATGGIEPRGFA